jgi:membrane protein
MTMITVGRNRWLRSTWVVLADSIGHLNSDDGWAMASHVALSGLMALFPFLIFVAALAGFVGQQPLAEQVANLMFQAWPPDVAGPIAGEVDQVVSGAGVNLLTVAAVVAAFLASSGVEAVRVALNRAYRVVERRSFIRLRAQSLLFVIAGAAGCLVLALLLALVPPVLQQIVGDVPVLEPFVPVVTFGRLIVPAVLIVGLLTTAHLWLPAGRPRWWRLWPGIAATLVLWLASALVFAVYIGRFSNLGATYGGLASVVAALFFLYVLAVSLIYGGELNASLTRLRDRRIG